MSYILDALKRSDEQRKQLNPDDKTTQFTPPPSAPRAKRPRFSGRMLLPLLLIGAALVLLFWWPGSAQPPGRTASSESAGMAQPAPQPKVAATDALSPTELSGVKLRLHKPAPPPPAHTQPRPAPVPKVISMPAPSKPMTSGAPVLAANAGSAGAQTPVSAPDSTSVPTPVDPYADLPYLRQMPVQVQRAMPDLRFSVHIYSETPAARMVKLGDRVLREGMSIAPGIRLEAIIPRGVVLDYRDYRFRVPAL